MQTLQTKKEFDNVYKSQKKWHCSSFTLFFKEMPNHSQKRVGFCVSKKTGKAVCRNFIKRRLRNIYKDYLPVLKGGDLVLLAKNGVDKVPYQRLKNEYHRALTKLDLIEKIC